MLVLLALLACADGPYPAPAGARIDTPIESFTFTWTAALADTDQLGYVYSDRVNVSIEDEYGRTLPLGNIEVDIQSLWPGTYLLPTGAVQTVEDFAVACAELSGDEEYLEICDVYAAESEAGNSYYELTGVYPLAVDEDGEPGTRPNYLRGTTDSSGQLDFWIFFDETPGAGSDFGITMDIGTDFTSVIVSTVAQEDK